MSDSATVDATFASIFGGLTEANLERSYAEWQRLDQQQNDLGMILNGCAKQHLDLSSFFEDLEKAKRELDYKVPYRIVVVGDTGAGKSTLINAILGRDLLLRGSGGAVTGAATYIYSAQAEEKQQICYRDGKDFLDLVQNIAQRYQITDLPSDSIISIENMINSGQLRTLLDLRELENREQLFKDIKDIVDTWARLRALNLVGKAAEMTDKQALAEWIEENSERNQSENTRIVPGIAKVEYFLKDDPAQKGILKEVVLIDTPGLGAKTLRHQQILQDEVKKAHAVILVVGARRPEQGANSVASLIKEKLLAGFSDEDQNKFASKVFLIINNIDEIRSDGDIKRLNKSIEDVAGNISPSYWALYAAPNRRNQGFGPNVDQRCFETVADAALFAQIKTSLRFKRGEGLERGDEEQFHKHVARIRQRYPQDSRSDEDILREDSNVSLFTRELYTFLSKGRLNLMLEQAKVLLNGIADKLRKQCEDTLHELLRDVGYDRKQKIEEIRAKLPRLILDICEKQLEQDAKDLKECYRVVIKQLNEWRRSEEYDDKREIEEFSIYAFMDKAVSERLDKLLYSKIVQQFYNPITGDSLVDGLPLPILQEAERALLAELEQRAAILAHFYFEKFDDLVLNQGLYRLLREKAYDQEYIGEAKIIAQLEEKCRFIHEEYSAICRHILLYEVMQWLFVLTSQHNLTQDEKTQASQEKAQLLAEITAAFAQPNFQNLINDKVIEELRVRSSTAFDQALPLLEDLFFYQLDKYGLDFERVINDLYAEHKSHVRDDQKCEDLQKKLMRRDYEKVERFNCALEVLERL